MFKSLLGDRGVEGRKMPCNGLFTGGVRGPEGCCQPAGIDSLKSANDTVCGPFAPRALPCLCFGGGGGPSASGRDVVGPIKDTCSLSSSLSSSEIDCWSKEVLGDSGCNSCAGPDRDCRDTEDVSVLLLLSCGRAGCVTGGEGLALPVIRRFLNMSTFILGGPAADFSLPRSSVVARCRPACASPVANVLANGLYGARIIPADTGGGSGSAPSEFRCVLSRACWRFGSAVDVAVVAATSSGVTVTGGGGGDPAFPSDNRLGLSGDSTGDCGGEMICTRFLGFPFFVLGGAVAFLS